MCSRSSDNSEANASELSEDLQDMFPRLVMMECVDHDQIAV